MYNNPYFNYPSFREQSQQPIQNIFTNQMPTQTTFMARFLKDGETPQEAFVNSKTALISFSAKKLYIKELDGTIVTYDIVMPKDEKDLQIEKLELEISKLKEAIGNVRATESVETDTIITQPIGDVKKSNRK